MRQQDRRAEAADLLSEAATLTRTHGPARLEAEVAAELAHPAGARPTGAPPLLHAAYRDRVLGVQDQVLDVATGPGLRPEL